MSVVQVSIFMEDKKGKLASVATLLGDNDVNILGFDVADTAEGYGIFRLITSDPERAADILARNGYTVSKNEVLSIYIDNKPGQLAKALTVLADNDSSVEYIYAIVGSVIVLKTDSLQSARKALEASSVRVLNMQDLLTHIQV